MISQPVYRYRSLAVALLLFIVPPNPVQSPLPAPADAPLPKRALEPPSPRLPPLATPAITAAPPSPAAYAATVRSQPKLKTFKAYSGQGCPHAPPHTLQAAAAARPVLATDAATRVMATPPGARRLTIVRPNRPGRSHRRPSMRGLPSISASLLEPRSPPRGGRFGLPRGPLDAPAHRWP